MEKRINLICFALFIFSFGCSDKGQDNNSFVDEKLKEQINNYLIDKEGIVGFGGEVFCDHILIGKEGDEYYIIYNCQEYYQVDDTQILKGTGTKIPAVLSKENGAIISIRKPRDGSAFTNDVNNLFPKKLVSKLRSKLSSTDWVSSEKLEAFKKKLQDKRRKNKELFNLIQNDSVDVDFYGGGSEPFWSIYLFDEEALFINSGIISKFEQANDFDSRVSSQIVVCENSTGNSMKIEIFKKKTFEELADKYYPYEVTIHLSNYGTLKGIGDLKKL